MNHAYKLTPADRDRIECENCGKPAEYGLHHHRTDGGVSFYYHCEACQAAFILAGLTGRYTPYYELQEGYRTSAWIFKL